MTKKYRPFHESIDRRILENSSGWGGIRFLEKVAVLVDMFDVLHGSAMPVEAAHKLANDHQNLPLALRKINRGFEANLIAGALEDLASRKDEPKKKSASGKKRK